MRVVYFARVREAIGIDAEDRDFPDELTTIEDAVDWLSRQGTAYAVAFADRSRLRFALDQHMAAADSLIAGKQELAIFPPVTGG